MIDVLQDYADSITSAMFSDVIATVRWKEKLKATIYDIVQSF